MKIELIKKNNGLEMYGNIPCLPVEIKNDEGERFVGEEDDSWLLLEDFVKGIDDVCANDLDYGDVEYFDYKKCIILQEWLNKRFESEMTPRLREVYGRLRDFIKMAIELKTGVVIEL